MPDDIVVRYLPRLEAELQLAVGSGGMRELMRYHLGWRDERGAPQAGGSGKRLRPLLCLLTCEALGGDWERALPAAVAIELVHNFSLIHDDIEDGSLQRRHRPSLWAAYGIPLALNAGDAMLALARQSLWRLVDNGFADAVVPRLQQEFDETCLALCQGQHLDLSYETRLDLATDDYLAMIAGKTAALISYALCCGATLAGGDAATVEALAICGTELGLTFQVRDDILGIWGTEAVAGKAVGADIASKKKTLPVVYALERAESVARARLHAIYSQETLSTDDVAEVMALLDGVGAQQYAQAVAERYLQQSLQSLDGIARATPAAVTLRELAEFLARRDY